MNSLSEYRKIRRLTAPDDGTEVSAGSTGVLPTVSALALLIATNVSVVANISIPVFRPIVGFWFIFVFPVYLLYTTSLWRRCALGERMGYSVCAVLLILMLSGLGINTILPVMGVQHPLDPDSILVLGDIIILSLYGLRRRYPQIVNLRSCFSEGIGRQEFRLLVMASLSVALAVLGVNRLNNGAGDQLTLIALGIATLVILLSLFWVSLIRDVVIYFLIYLTSLSLLLSTSLRGWYVTGHDVQEEYRVFQLTEAHAHWSMSYFHDAYNACLSITVLPTEIGQIINVDSPYVFKLFFQLIFAACPVLVYVIARRYSNRFVSILSVAYFIGFPTFFTDMPFLNRQEIAFLFVAVGVLAATNSVWSFRRRQLALIAVGIGIELSHYSTMYVFLGTVAIAWISRSVAGLLTKSRPGWLDTKNHRIRWAPGAGKTLTIGSIAVLVGIIFLWGDLATNTSGQVLKTSESAITALAGNSSNTRSGNVSFSLIGGGTVPPSAVLQEYRQATFKIRSEAPGFYLPKSAVEKAKTPVVSQQVLPLTEVGRALSDLGIPVVSVNSLLRNLIAYCEQLFLIVGLLRFLIIGRQQWRRIGQELYWLCIGSIGFVGLITVLPALSADYGVLRAFQEALIIIGPVIVAGSMAIFELARVRRAQICAAVVCLCLFIATIGLVPQVLGGNLAELNLNNSGVYYDLYYMRPEDEAAVAWLEKQPNVLSYPIQASYLQTKFNFTNPDNVNGEEAIIDLYPTIVIKNSWVILSYPTVDSDLAYTFTRYNGDLISYKYPSGLLQDNKNLVYSNGETQIYK